VSRVPAARAAAVRGLPVGFLAALLALSGCSWFSSSSSTPPAACPNAVILRSLANTAVFAPGAAPSPDNVRFYGLLSEVDRSCEAAGDAMRVTLDVIVIGQRGPGAKSDAVDLTYFVAVTGPDQQIISKKPFAVHIAFDPDQIRSGVTDHIVETIPLAGRRASDINLVLGFQQPPEVVDFYRHYRGR
jgi:hypothetical protein